MGLAEAFRDQQRKLRRAIRRAFRVPLLKLSSVDRLSPFQRFVRDGYNSKIYSSIPAVGISEVLIFGGYKGASAREWLRKSPGAKIHIYEPVPEFALSLEKDFNSSNVTIHESGVGEKGGFRNFSMRDDATSGHPGRVRFLSDSDPKIQVRFESAVQASRVWATDVDVAEINIEGGEYELISALADAGALSRINHVFVQFHDVGPGTERFVQEARARLIRSHSMVWSYDLVWEYWRLSPDK